MFVPELMSSHNEASQGPRAQAKASESECSDDDGKEVGLISRREILFATSWWVGDLTTDLC